MTFSVCIINWNWLEILKPTIDNLREERKTVDLEIIILDNGSVDGSQEWLKDQNDLISILNSENVGSAIGRNQMIRVAKGDFILMMDSDILYINGSLNYFKNRFDDLNFNAKCIGFNPKYFTNDLKTYTPQLPSIEHELLKHEVSFASYALTQYGLFKSEVFDKCMFDENYKVGWGFEDDDLFFQMQALKWDVYQLDCSYYHAKQTSKWNKTHVLSETNYYDRASYFREKWNWGK